MVNEHFNNVTIKLLGDEESPIADDIGERCNFFNILREYQLDIVIAPGAPNLNKDKSLGILWHDIDPNNGSYKIDLAVELPYCLPEFEGKPEYSIQIGKSELFVSTRMIRCYVPKKTSDIKPKSHDSSLNYYLIHQLALKNLIEQTNIQQIHPVPIGTFVAKTFSVQAETAETAINENLYLWVEEMADEVTRLFEAIRVGNPEKCKHLPVIVRPSSFSTHFLVLTGAEGRSGNAQFVTDFQQSIFRSLSNLDVNEFGAVKEFLKSEQPIPAEENAIGLARTFLHQGHKELALVQISVACESVLSRKYREFVSSRGVSNTKYSDVDNNITFSSLLKVHIYAMVEINKLSDYKKILSQLDWVRTQRNEIVHTGKLNREISNIKTEEALEAACKLIKFLSVYSI